MRPGWSPAVAPGQLLRGSKGCGRGSARGRRLESLRPDTSRGGPCAPEPRASGARRPPVRDAPQRPEHAEPQLPRPMPARDRLANPRLLALPVPGGKKLPPQDTHRNAARRHHRPARLPLAVLEEVRSRSIRAPDTPSRSRKSRFEFLHKSERWSERSGAPRFQARDGSGIDGGSKP